MHSLTEINIVTHNFKHACCLEDFFILMLPKAIKIKLYLSDIFGITNIFVFESDSFPEYSILFYLKQICHQFHSARWLSVGQDKTTREYFCSSKTLTWNLASSCGISTHLPTSCPAPKPTGTNWKTPIALERILIKLIKQSFAVLVCIFLSVFCTQLGRSALQNRRVC